MLEWVTAEDGEKNKKTTLKDHYLEMKILPIFGLFFMLANMFWIKILGALWLVGPIFAWYISLDNNKVFIAANNGDYVCGIICTINIYLPNTA